MELICSVLSANINKVKESLLSGADVNYVDENGNNSLTIATYFDYYEIVKILVHNGANVNLKNNDGDTSLIIGSRGSYCEIVKSYILSRGRNIKKNDVHLEIVKLLVLHGADVNSINKNGESSLIVASVNGHSDIVKLLVKNGADVNIKDKDGNTSLICASYRGYLEIVKILAPISNIYHVNKLGQSAFIVTTNEKIIGELCKYATKMVPLNDNINDNINDINDYL